jgi:hypothetical protein
MEPEMAQLPETTFRAMLSLRRRPSFDNGAG